MLACQGTKMPQEKKNVQTEPFILKFIYLFTFGCAGSLLGHWLFFFFLTGFSVVVARWGYSLVVERGLSGTWASVVVAPGL